MSTVATKGAPVELRSAGVEIGTDGNPLRTSPASSPGTQPVSGTVTANAGTNLNTSALALETGGNLAAAATSLTILDDWDESDRAKVNTIAGQVGVQGGSGVVTALTQRMCLATDVSLPTGTNSVGRVAAGGVSKEISANFTRPSDTTAYAAGDAVTNSTSAPVAITFSNCARTSGGTGFITGITMIDSANQATAGSFELWIFTASPTPDNDNAVFTPTDAECETLVGIYPLTTSYVGDATSGANGNRVYESDTKVRHFTCATTDLYGLCVVRNAYTPVSAEKFTFICHIQQD